MMPDKNPEDAPATKSMNEGLLAAGSVAPTLQAIVANQVRISEAMAPTLQAIVAKQARISEAMAPTLQAIAANRERMSETLAPLLRNIANEQARMASTLATSAFPAYRSLAAEIVTTAGSDRDEGAPD